MDNDDPNLEAATPSDAEYNGYGGEKADTPGVIVDFPSRERILAKVTPNPEDLTPLFVWQHLIRTAGERYVKTHPLPYYEGMEEDFFSPRYEEHPNLEHHKRHNGARPVALEAARILRILGFQLPHYNPLGSLEISNVLDQYTQSKTTLGSKDVYRYCQALVVLFDQLQQDGGVSFKDKLSTFSMRDGPEKWNAVEKEIMPYYAAMYSLADDIAHACGVRPHEEFEAAHRERISNTMALAHDRIVTINM